MFRVLSKMTLVFTLRSHGDPSSVVANEFILPDDDVTWMVDEVRCRLDQVPNTTGEEVDAAGCGDVSRDGDGLAHTRVVTGVMVIWVWGT